MKKLQPFYTYNDNIHNPIVFYWTDDATKLFSNPNEVRIAILDKELNGTCGDTQCSQCLLDNACESLQEIATLIPELYTICPELLI